MNDTPPPLVNGPLVASPVRRIRIRRIKAGSLFRLIFLATGALVLPLVAFIGVLALFGAHTVRFASGSGASAHLSLGNPPAGYPLGGSGAAEYPPAPPASGEYVTGVKGLLGALVMGPVFTLLFSFFAWVGAYAGIRLYGCFRPLTIDYVPADE